MTELLPQRKRSTRFHAISEYPNTLTLESVIVEIESRIAGGFTPVQAFLTVAEGVRNWNESETRLGC